MEQSTSLVEYGFRRGLVTFTAIICTFMAAMNITAVNVAFYDIKGNLGASVNQVSWIMTAYFLAYIISMPFSSWLSRSIGRKNYFTIAVALFTVASFLCGNATEIHELLFLRFLQGLGGGAMLVSAHIVITESWPVEKRATSQAFYFLGLLAAGAVAGPLAGYLVDYYAWPYIFYVNIPIGIIACILILSCVRKSTYDAKNEDWLSAITLTVGVSALYIVFARGEEAGWFDSMVITALLLIGLAGVILFILRQVKLIPRSGEKGLLQNADLRAALILCFITAFCVAAAVVTTTSALKGWGVHIISPVPLNTSIWALAAVLLAGASLVEKGEALKYIIATGMLVFAIYSYMLFKTGSEGMSSTYAILLIIIRSLAVALLYVSVSTLALSKLEGKQIGQGVALYNVVHQLGAAFGIAAFSRYASWQAGLRREAILREIDNPETKKQLINTMLRMGKDTSMIDYKSMAYMQANMAKPAEHSPHIFIMTMGVILLVCIPFVLYFVKSSASRENE